MRSKRLELMDQISAYIDQYYCERQTTPSVNEVALGVGVSKATAYRYLVAMDERGMLEYDGSSRTISNHRNKADQQVLYRQLLCPGGQRNPLW